MKIRCTRCKKEKDSSLYKPLRKAEGKVYNKQCKDCRDYQKSVDKNRHKNQTKYKNKPTVKAARYVYDAKKRSIEWELKNWQAIDLIKRNCYYCGLEGGGIDRVDSAKPYSEDNCRPCCTSCNYAKHTLSLELFLEKCKLIADRHCS